MRRRLSRAFRVRIEMRQIGPRDVAKIIGGYGACGGPRCCSTFLTEFSPISIRMAKAQGVSLSPSEITGMCGRLRCCLLYEYEQYAERYDKEIEEADGAGALDGMSSDQRLARVQELRRERFWKLADAVYAERGWDADGIPTDELLERVGLTDSRFADVARQARSG